MKKYAIKTAVGSEFQYIIIKTNNWCSWSNFTANLSKDFLFTTKEEARAYMREQLNEVDFKLVEVNIEEILLD